MNKCKKAPWEQSQDYKEHQINQPKHPVQTPSIARGDASEPTSQVPKQTTHPIVSTQLCGKSENNSSDTRNEMQLASLGSDAGSNTSLSGDPGNFSHFIHKYYSCYNDKHLLHHFKRAYKFSPTKHYK